MPAKFLAKEAIAEVLPSDMAVKKPEVKMLNPDSRKLKPKSQKPFTVSSWAWLPAGRNMLIRGSASTLEPAKETREKMPMVKRASFMSRMISR